MRAHGLLAGLAALALLAPIAACDLDLQDQAVGIESTGVVQGVVFQDQNGSGALESQLDSAFDDFPVWLLVAGGSRPVEEAAADTNGVYEFPEVPVGTFRLGVDSAFLGDTLEIVQFDASTFTLASGDTVVRTFGAKFPEVTLAEVRDLEEGRKIFTTGIVLNSRPDFGDPSIHARAGGVAIRVTDLPQVAAFPGDSVRFLGRTGRLAGRPILTEARLFVLAGRVVLPRAVDTNTGGAASAESGSLAADLVRITDAAVQDTVTVDGDLVITVDDGSGPVEIVMREFLGYDLSFIPDSIVFPDSVSVSESTGLLVPAPSPPGAQGPIWQLHPRTVGDLAVEFR